MHQSYNFVVLLISKKKWWCYNTIYFVSLLIIDIPVDIKMRNNWPLISRLFFVVGLQRVKKAKDQRQSWKSLRASKNCWVKKVDKTFFPVLVGKSAKNKLQKRIPSKLPIVMKYCLWTELYSKLISNGGLALAILGL